MRDVPWTKPLLAVSLTTHQNWIISLDRLKILWNFKQQNDAWDKNGHIPDMHKEILWLWWLGMHLQWIIHQRHKQMTIMTGDGHVSLGSKAYSAYGIRNIIEHNNFFWLVILNDFHIDLSSGWFACLKWFYGFWMEYSQSILFIFFLDQMKHRWNIMKSWYLAYMG